MKEHTNDVRLSRVYVCVCVSPFIRRVYHQLRNFSTQLNKRGVCSMFQTNYVYVRGSICSSRRTPRPQASLRSSHPLWHSIYCISLVASALLLSPSVRYIYVLVYTKKIRTCWVMCIWQQHITS